MLLPVQFYYADMTSRFAAGCISFTTFVFHSCDETKDVGLASEAQAIHVTSIVFRRGFLGRP